MPLYDYACTQCGHRLEVIHGIHAAGPAECPSCGAVGTMRKGFTPPTVHFKGSGWAKKDRRSTAASKTKAEAKDEAASTSGEKAAATTAPKGESAASGGSAATSGSSGGDD